MKKIVLVLLLLFIEINANGIQPSDSNFNSKNPIDIPLNGQKVPPPGGAQHAPALSLVSAYIDNDTVIVDFTSANPTATITITDQTTGEIIYTEVCNTQNADIDMSLYCTEEGHTYVLDITTATWHRYGIFIY